MRNKKEGNAWKCKEAEKLSWKSRKAGKSGEAEKQRGGREKQKSGKAKKQGNKKNGRNKIIPIKYCGSA